MSEGETRRIAHELMSEPHIRGRRVSVRQVYALVEERGKNPEAVADQYDLNVADVYHALAYYHDHLREMRDVKYLGGKPRGFTVLSVEAERDDAMGDFRESIDRPEGVGPHAA